MTPRRSRSHSCDASLDDGTEARVRRGSPTTPAGPAAANENRDFILSLDATIVYLVIQLWAALEDHDGEQWLYCLGELGPLDQTGRIAKAHMEWVELIRRYGDGT